MSARSSPERGKPRTRCASSEDGFRENRAQTTTCESAVMSRSTPSTRRSPTASAPKLDPSKSESFAHLVLWHPAFFGVKPEMVIKGGFIAWSQMGDANASIPTPQPVVMRPMFGAYGTAGAATSLAFVSKVSLEEGSVQRYGLRKQLYAVHGCRALTKADLKLNGATPKMHVDPETVHRHGRRRRTAVRTGIRTAARAKIFPFLIQHGGTEILRNTMDFS